MKLRDVFIHTKRQLELPNIANLRSYSPLRVSDYAILANMSYIEPLSTVPKQFKSAVFHDGYFDKYLNISDTFWLSATFYNLAITDSHGGYSGFSCFRISKISEAFLGMDLIIAHTGTDSNWDRVTTWSNIAVNDFVDQHYVDSGFDLYRKSCKQLGISLNAKVINSGKYNVVINVVHVGHSLGGAISRVVSTNVGHHYWVGFDVPQLKNKAGGMAPAGVKASAHNVMGSIVSWSKNSYYDEVLGYTDNSFGKYGIIEKHNMLRILKEQVDPHSGDWIDANTEQYTSDRLNHGNKFNNLRRTQRGRNAFVYGNWPKI